MKISGTYCTHTVIFCNEGTSTSTSEFNLPSSEDPWVKWSELSEELGDGQVGGDCLLSGGSWE
jgi:hypothetical protein